MRPLRLQLADYRNFHRLELELTAGPSVFVGDNAQGKTNLLEAIYLLATMRDLRADTDAQLLRWEAQGEVAPAARIVGEAQTKGGTIKLEVAVIARPGADGLLAAKVARVNGVPKRLAEAVGILTAVLFTAHDLDLITGPPSLRRRYLDLTISQVDRAYLGARQRFEKVLLQRNHLLKRLREGLARREELDFWDEKLARDGGYLIWARARAIAGLGTLGAEAHAALADEQLQLAYLPRLETNDAQTLADSPQAVADAYANSLRRSLEREIAAGMTLLGPHRDDLAFSLNGLSAASFASRAQQRTIALALRLAEARYLHSAREGESPLLLLDDVLSEMDAARRRCVLDALSGYEQVLITTTDLDRFSQEFLAGAALFSVRAGNVSPLPSTSLHPHPSLSLEGEG